MDDLFTRLYRYREREQKHNLEDWLTEALAAVLRSLTREQLCQTLATLCGERLLAADDLRVETQVQAGRFGRPDLVVYQGEKAIVLFENKVAHSVSAETDEDGKIRHQLHRYAAWLREQAGDEPVVQSLVFLTHLTPPPDDFSPKAGFGEYQGVLRHVTSWGEMSRVLSRVTEEEGDRSLAYGLTRAFQSMLEEQSMANEYPDSKDLAAVELFLAHGATVENLVDQMWRQVSKVAPSNTAREASGPDTENGCYAQYRYVNRIDRLPNQDRNFLSTGVWFPGIGRGWEPSDLAGHDPVGAQVYLLFGNDYDNNFAQVTGSPGEGRFRPENDFLTIRPLHDFHGNPDARASAIMAWVGARGEELRSFLLQQKLTT